MDYRERTFQKKFEDAASHLKVRPDQVISLKLRESVGSYQDYQDLMAILQREARLDCVQIDADLQGRGFLIGDSRAKIILVEHETGLELLYVAGSVASFIALIPLVLQGWRSLRGHFGRRHPRFHDAIEIRQLDSSGNLREDHLPSVESYLSLTVFAPQPAITDGLVQEEMESLNQQVLSLTRRIDALEKQLSVKDNATKPKASKKKPSGTVSPVKPRTKQRSNRS